MSALLGQRDRPIQVALSIIEHFGNTFTVKVDLKAPDFTDFEAALAPKQGLSGASGKSCGPRQEADPR